MIVKMPLVNNSIIMIGDKSSRCNSSEYRRRDIVITYRQLVLVLLELDNILFIAAAAIAFMNFHSALAAGFRAVIK